MAATTRCATTQLHSEFPRPLKVGILPAGNHLKYYVGRVAINWPVSRIEQAWYSLVFNHDSSTNIVDSKRHLYWCINAHAYHILYIIYGPGQLRTGITSTSNPDKTGQTEFCVGRSNSSFTHENTGEYRSRRLPNYNCKYSFLSPFCHVTVILLRIIQNACKAFGNMNKINDAID